jgi:hypothetical protein
VRAEVEKRRVEQEKVAEELERLRPLTEAKQGGRWWTGAWWRATFQGGAVAHAADLQIRTEKLREEQARLDQEVNQLAREGTAADDAYAAERTRLVGAEVQRRQARLDDEAAALRQEQNLLQAKWQATCQEMGLAPEPAISREAAREARQAWEQGRVQNEQERAFADQWVRSLEETLDGLPRRLAACFNVVAATTTGLPAGDPFTGRGPNGHPFDRLILDEADRITDSEFLAAARNAPCWVLVGEPANPDHPSRSTDRKAKSSGFRSAIRDPRSAFFQRLWPQLHADPQQLPYAWGRREGHLFCRLRHVPRGHEQWIERECVVDRPDIELHIVAVPRQAPQLAEVVFPPGMPIEQAKQFVFQELEELPLQAPGHGLWWVEGPERIELRLTPDDDAAAVSVVLEPGVRELVRVPAPGAECDGPWYTCGIHFDRDAGWSRERAEDWVEKYLSIRDRGRTALLTKPHRWRPPLACILADLLGANWDRSAGPSAPECASLEFVAVPPASEPEVARRVEAEGRRRSGGTATAVPRQRGARGGAGLEIDLADNRPLEPLPEELRAFLPSDGLVNYFEARAVVQALESLVAEETFRAEAEAWPPRHKAPCLLASEGCVSGGQGLSSSYRPVHSPAVVVMALYSAQAELIRLLIRQSPTLAVCDISLEVGLPSDFRQRECLAALVSLTRSHVHRAVTFGEVPELLTLALTRAAARLLIFGDPGTLERRASWQGALDHLDPTEAEQERTLVLGLLRFAHPLPLTPSINHHPEGGSA